MNRPTTISGDGSASPAPIKLPGASSATDPGILVNIHAAMSEYIAPGPEVYTGGTSKTPSANPVCPAASGLAAGSGSGTGSSPATTLRTTAKPTVTATSTKAAAPTVTAASSGVCVAAKYAQCGGTGFAGCTTCAVSSL